MRSPLKPIIVLTNSSKLDQNLNTMKTTTRELRKSAPPTLFQIAASLESSESPAASKPHAPQNEKRLRATKSDLPNLRKARSQPIGFRLEAPSARSVELAADFTGWEQAPVKLTRRDDGVWLTALALPPGNYSYRFIVDGQWCDDPSCMQRVANPFGTMNAVITVT